MTNHRVFPFTAVVGHEDMKLALLLNAIDRRIGGVLLRGQKGSAKSTLARALASLLPRGSSFVELPINASEDRVVGSIDLQLALTEGKQRFHPGLLADADHGVLYVDEVNLLPDHLVDVLLDVAASGINRVERDSMSESHPSRFVLVGSMNPEEGELRPQLLDRFGLTVDVVSSDEVGDRVEAVRRRLDFDADPEAFAASWSERECELKERLAGVALAEVPDSVAEAISQLCVAVGTEGLRADIVLNRAVAALAGWESRSVATIEDIRRVAPLVLAHRRRRQPFDDPGIEQSEIDDALDRTPPDASPHHGAAEPDADGDGDGGGDAESAGGRESDARSGAGGSPRAPAAADAPSRIVPLSGPRTASSQASGRRSIAESSRGRIIGDRAPEGELTDLAVGATVRTAALRKSRETTDATERSQFQPLVMKDDLREAVREQKTGNLLILTVDASGSMGVHRRMEAVKGAVLSLLLDAYQRRDRVALVTFGGETAEVVLRPTGSVEVARSRLASLATGGRTPLAAGIEAATSLAKSAPESHRPFLILISDGRATSGPAGTDPLESALAAAAQVRKLALPSVLLDVEDGPLRLGLAGPLAAAMGAEHLLLPELSAGALTTTIKNVVEA
jgi:magnesium chelatase subunit D